MVIIAIMYKTTSIQMTAISNFMLRVNNRHCMSGESAAGSSNGGVGVTGIFQIRVQVVISIGSLK